MALVVAESAVDSLVPVALHGKNTPTTKGTKEHKGNAGQEKKRAIRRLREVCQEWVYVFASSGDGCFLRAAPEAACRWPGAPWLSRRWWRGSALVFSSWAREDLTTKGTKETQRKNMALHSFVFLCVLCGYHGVNGRARFLRREGI